MKSTTLLIRGAVLCAALLMVSLPAFSQGSKWWQSDEFKRELVLVPEQTKLLEEIFQKAVPTLKQQKSRLDQAEAKFQRLIQEGDQSAMEQINVVEMARMELNKTRAQMLWNMRKVLTEQQYVKLTALQAAANKATTQGKPANGSGR
jgi:hypothetical protein